MSVPTSEDFRRAADSFRELADSMREQAGAMLNDDNAFNDVIATDMFESAAEYDLMAAAMDAAAAFMEWFEDDGDEDD